MIHWDLDKITGLKRVYLKKPVSIGLAINTMKNKKKRSHKGPPRLIVTDGLQSYKKAIKKEFRTVKKETIHIGNVSMRGKKIHNRKFDNNLVERLQETVRDRNKTQRGLKSEDSVFIKGHQLYYNFIKSHEGLNGYTPAHFANIYLGLDDNKWHNLLMQSIKYQIENKDGG